MQEFQHLQTAAKTEIAGRTVTLFFESQFIMLHGDWTWDLNADSVFCSDVILSFPIEFTGTKAIIHPEDKPGLQRKLFSEPGISNIHFRVITTYGEIRTLEGKNLSLELDNYSTESWKQEVIRKAEEEKELPHLQLLKDIYFFSEKDLKSGAWYHNKSTNETWYSSQVFRLFDLAPHSLNATLNTFNSFIHPEDRETATEFFHQAYKQQKPLHIEFRIITPVSEKTVRLLVNWTFSLAGEVICCGTYQDISGQKALEDLAEHTKENAEFNKQLLYLDEQQAGLGHWDINLITRKVRYSDNLYRMFGLKPHSVNPGLNALLNFIHPDDQEAYEQANRAMIQKHTVPDIEFRIIRSDNKVRFFQQRSRLVNIGDELLMCGVVQDITVQRSLEKKIASLVSYHSLTKNLQYQSEMVSMSASWLWDLDTGKIDWSEGIFSLLGSKPTSAEFSLKRFLVYIYSSDQKKFNDSIALVTQEKREVEFDFRLTIKGRIKFIKASFRLLSDDNKNYFYAAFHDQSSLYASEQELNELTQFTNALSENLQEQIIITDQDNQVIFWSRQCEMFYNVKKEEAEGKNIFELIPSLKTGPVLSWYDRVLKGETIQENDFRLSNKGQFQLKLIPLWKKGHTEVYGIIHLIQDVSKEYELKRNLNERLSFIENIVESSVDQIISLDMNLNFLIWNKQCEKHYGLAKKEVIGKNLLDIFPSSKNLPAFEDFRKAMKGERVHIPANPQWGKEQYNEVYLLPVKNEKNEIIAVLWVLHDLSNEFDLNAQILKVDAILESLNECYFETDRNFRFTHVNKLTEEFWSRKKEDLIGKKYTEVFPQAEGSEILQLMQETMDTGKSNRGEYFSVITNRWIYISMTKTEDGLAAVFFDLQKMKDVEKLVKENEHLLQQINKTTPDSITIYNLKEKQPVYLNDCLADWTGFSNRQLIDMGMEGRLQLIHPEDRPRIVQFNKMLETAPDKVVNTIDYRLKGRSRTVWIRNRSIIFKRDEDGNPSHLLSILQDATLEIEMVKKLEERSQYAESVIDASIDQIIILDPQFRIITWNKKAEKVFGIERKTATGKKFFECFPKLKDDELIYGAYKQAAEGIVVRLEPRKALYSEEISERFYIPLKDENGHTYAILNIIHDVTDIVNQHMVLADLNNELEKKNRELKQKNEEITNFSFVASHDLKEPLRKIHTFSDWLLVNEQDNISGTGKNYLGRLQSSVRRLERLIDDILVLMRVHSDRERLEEVSLQDIVKEVTEDLRESYPEFSITASDLPVIKANRNQVFVLFRNLVQNSIKFCQPGQTPEITILSSTANAEEPGDSNGRQFIKISFLDNGKGIAPKYFRKIFQVFQKLDSSDDCPGTGMGLAICKKVMENHEGCIKIESEAGKGSAFHCYFPVVLDK